MEAQRVQRIAACPCPYQRPSALLCSVSLRHPKRRTLISSLQGTFLLDCATYGNQVCRLIPCGCSTFWVRKPHASLRCWESHVFQPQRGCRAWRQHRHELVIVLVPAQRHSIQFAAVCRRAPRVSDRRILCWKSSNLMLYFSSSVRSEDTEYVGCYPSMLILTELTGIHRSQGDIRIVSREGGQS